MEVTDEVLVERFRQGDRAAFSELVSRHQRSIYHFALRMSGREEDARDLTQRTFLRAYSALAGFEGRSSVRTWLHRIVGNLCRNHHRDTHRVTFVEVDDADAPEAPKVLDVLTSHQTLGQLREAVEALPPRQRSVLTMRVYEDLPFRDIAEREGITEGNARVSYHLAVKALKARLGEDAQEVSLP